jgi:hypothetical protein
MFAVQDSVDTCPARQASLARIAAASWHDYGFGAHAYVAADDGEVLVLLSLRFASYCKAPGDDSDLYVVDATDRCYRGLENAKAASVRDLKVGLVLA